ncbi:MAG: hypothetical protein ACI9TI_001192 [Natronomonas sp.]|mgnify:CR=1 FL=1|jgi:hypothetical protein|uniref:hypothetical protein n=1 Tax=Natronomonas sp. TaxID=2184060 RepID=UPI00398A3CA5
MTDEQQRRRQEAFLRRNRVARQQLLQATYRTDESVGDDDPVTNFGKALEHDADGVPTEAAYRSLVEALEDGSIDAFNDIMLEDGDDRPRRLVEPHGALAFQKSGADPHMLQIRPHPPFASDQSGAEMVELYWRASCRDVQYGDYDSNTMISSAVDELEGMSGYNGPGSDADPRAYDLSSDNLFRGIVPGAQKGPRISQFLWKAVPRGAIPLSQRIRVLTGAEASVTFDSGDTTLTFDGPDYLTDFETWKKVQNGVPVPDVNPPPNLVVRKDDPDKQVQRHIITGRDLANKVRRQVPYLSIRDAAEILLGMGVPFDPNIPYGTGTDEIGTGRPFINFGSNDVLDIVVNVFISGQNVCWYRKWKLHRRLRPEEYGGRIHAQRERERSFDIPENVLDSDVLKKTEKEPSNGGFGSSLLPQAYTEGSPTHPSFPAGHSGVAGACVTTLKAMFDGTHAFSNDQMVVPIADGTTNAHLEGGGTTNVQQTTLSTIADESGGTGGTIAATQQKIDGARDSTVTVNDELNKLAANMAFGRNWAGIHYRTDGIDGFLVGEQAAVRYLQEHMRQYDLPFDGFRLEPFFDTYPGTLVGAKPNAPDTPGDRGQILIKPDGIENLSGMERIDDPLD